MLQCPKLLDLNDLGGTCFIERETYLIPGNLTKGTAGELYWWRCHLPTMTPDFLVSASFLLFLFWDPSLSLLLFPFGYSSPPLLSRFHALGDTVCRCR